MAADTTSLSGAARAEFDRRAAVCRDAVARRLATAAQADGRLLPWAALVRFVGGELPDDLAAPDGGQRHWLDWFPVTMRASEATRLIATELRRATLELLRRHAFADHDAALTERTRNLLRLDDHVSIRAGLAPI